MTLEPLDPAAIAANLDTLAVPRTIRSHATVGSTMDLARELLGSLDQRQLPALVVANEQTTGRGRMGRVWVAPSGSALLASLALRPTWLAPEQGVALVWMTAVSLCEAVEEITPLRPGLKWPNDLLVDVAAGSNKRESTDSAQLSHHPASPEAPDRDPRSPLTASRWAKAAGILLEVSLGPSSLEWAILGCGVNVSAAPPAGSARFPATSLAEAAGAPVSRLELLRALLRRLDFWYARLQADGAGALFGPWRARLVTLGQHVRVETPGGPIAGLAEDVTPAGGLLVREATGTLHTITAGDVGLAP